MINKRGVVDFVESASPVCPRNSCPRNSCPRNSHETPVPSVHETPEAYEKIDGGKGGSYAAGHNAALQREMELRDQRPYLKEYNTGAGGPANSPNPQGGIIIKR
jgi:hypothetical protein